MQPQEASKIKPAMPDHNQELQIQRFNHLKGVTPNHNRTTWKEILLNLKAIAHLIPTGLVQAMNIQFQVREPQLKLQDHRKIVSSQLQHVVTHQQGVILLLRDRKTSFRNPAEVPLLRRQLLQEQLLLSLLPEPYQLLNARQILIQRQHVHPVR
jgi:hypothetical protein